jgi:hypothetical protein
MRFVRAIPALAVLLLAACDREATAPRMTHPVMSAQGATQEHSEFSFYVSNDFYLACLDEVTHWEGPVTGSVDITTTPSGNVIARVKAHVDPTFFVERPNGVRYYPVGPAQATHLTELVGPVYRFSVTEPSIFESLAGERIVFTYHFQVVIDKNGNAVVEKGTGVCP